MPYGISAMPHDTSAMPGDISGPNSPPDSTWTDPARLDDFALPVAQQKIGKQLVRHLTRAPLSRSPRGTPRLASGRAAGR